MSTTTTPDLSALDLGGASVGQSLDGAQGAAYILQVYAHTILQTPSVPLPANIDTVTGTDISETLPQDLTTAQGNASDYIDTINPQLIQLSSQVVGYANEWNSMYQDMLTYAADLDSGDNRQNLIDTLNLLINKAHTGKTMCDRAGSSLATFSTSVDQDAANLSADYTVIYNAYGEGSAEQEDLQAIIDATNKAMTEDIVVMGASGLGILIGGGMVLIGIFGEIESAGLTTTLVVGGFAVAAGSAVAGSLAMVNYMDQNKALVKATNAMNAVDAFVAGTQQAYQTVSSLQSAASNGSSAAQSLSNSWDSLAGDLGQLVGALATAEGNLDSSQLTNLLNTANTDWNDALELAEQLQAGGSLPVSQQDLTQSSS